MKKGLMPLTRLQHTFFHLAMVKSYTDQGKERERQKGKRFDIPYMKHFQIFGAKLSLKLILKFC